MINILNKDIITLIDLELVSDDFSLKNRWHQPSDFPEIIQIGALRAIYENGKFSEQDGFLEVIKPQLHSNIPNYTLNLLKKKKHILKKE